MCVVNDFLNLPFGTHLIIGTTIRLFLILYAQFHDQMFTVQYTDVDYKVFTDASWYILNGESPYKRHTYRYSPLIALILIPNVLLNSNFGKILFSFFDILVGVVIKKLVKDSKIIMTLQFKRSHEYLNKIGSRSALFWIYNPLAIGIATRGNADSLTSFLVIMSLLFHETDIVKGLKKYFISGIFLGFAIHLRIYPLVFSLPMFLALGEYKIRNDTNILSDLYELIPNRKQLCLAFGCIMSLCLLTSLCFVYYGYEFLFEAYIYHFMRKDIRHNFSLFFYLQYLTADEKYQYWFKAIPFMMLTTYFGLRYGRKNTLNFALFTQAVILVIYNSVITSQYFIWFLSLLPLCIYDIQLSVRKGVLLFTAWISMQGAWLYHAYQIEYRGKNFFMYLWVQCVLFHITNLYIFLEIVKNYRPRYICEVREK